MSHPDMEYRTLGRCGTRVSVLGLGSWTTYGGSVTEENTIREIIHAAFEAGINFYDLADVYANGESEKAMGKVLKDFARYELVISSKTYFPMSDEINDRGLSRKHIMESVEKSLKRIGTDYLDIYFCHRYDEDTPLEETVRAMDDLIRQGKILYWGTSEWGCAQLLKVRELSQSRLCYHPQVDQPQYSLLAREKFEKEVQPVGVEKGLGLVVWSPLASGVLTGKYNDSLPEDSRLSRMDWLKERWYNEETLAKVRQLKKKSDELEVTCSQLALAWVAAQTGVSSVITGATRLSQLQENLNCLAIDITGDLDQELKDIFPY